MGKSVVYHNQRVILIGPAKKEQRLTEYAGAAGVSLDLHRVLFSGRLLRIHSPFPSELARVDITPLGNPGRDHQTVVYHNRGDIFIAPLEKEEELTFHMKVLEQPMGGRMLFASRYLLIQRGLAALPSFQIERFPFAKGLVVFSWQDQVFVATRGNEKRLLKILKERNYEVGRNLKRAEFDAGMVEISNNGGLTSFVGDVERMNK